MTIVPLDIDEAYQKVSGYLGMEISPARVKLGEFMVFEPERKKRGGRWDVGKNSRT